MWGKTCESSSLSARTRRYWSKRTGRSLFFVSEVSDDLIKTIGLLSKAQQTLSSHIHLGGEMSFLNPVFVVIDHSSRPVGMLYSGQSRVATFFSKLGGLHAIKMCEDSNDSRLRGLVEYKRDILVSSLPDALDCSLPAVICVGSGDGRCWSLVGKDDEPLGDFRDYDSGESLIDIALDRGRICSGCASELAQQLYMLVSFGLLLEERSDIEQQVLQGLSTLYEGVGPPPELGLEETIALSLVANAILDRFDL